VGGTEMIKVLITGSQGFIGKNLAAELEHLPEYFVMKCDRNTDISVLKDYVEQADFIFHLAGVNRPQKEMEFMEGNRDLTQKLLELLKSKDNHCPVMLASSIQAEQNNLYGNSKRAAEECVLKYHQETGNSVYIYRFPNIFGKWCRPNYNSVITTFCYNIARDMPIEIHDVNTVLHLVYIDDVIEEMKRVLSDTAHMDKSGFGIVPVSYQAELGDIARLIRSFKESRQTGFVPNMSDGLTRKLYSTYLSYLPENEFSYPLTMHKDQRGSFTEILRTADRGQFSVNISKPGITKGNHWHHTKNEKFLVVSGQGVIYFRKVGEKHVLEYPVNGEELKVVDIPPGYTHSIVNTGNTDLVTFMWCNECFDPEHPDTIPLEV
jgi:UDP-2-acetamido-2,6-beta-L-arabino-hexul-4-ose reductase